MTDVIRIAAVSCPAPFGDVDGNFSLMEGLLQGPGTAGADIVCFPECSLTGYCLSKDALDLAEEVPGPLTERLIQTSSTRGCAVIAGFIERSGGEFFITQVAAGPGGLIGLYRKMHLSPGEQRLFAAGSETPVFRWKGFSFGIGLCYDAHFPELATLYALAGADIIFYPHASPPPETPAEKLARWLRYLPARAYDNGLYVAACNQCGDNGRAMVFQGASLVLDPKGEILDSSHGDGAAIAAADVRRDVIGRVRSSSMGYFLKERRPGAYGGLAGN
ncbi:MAG: nitrilase [Spirochaetes bacterium]|nr:nitrilase [Spirochaetota bacterium]